METLDVKEKVMKQYLSEANYTELEQEPVKNCEEEFLLWNAEQEDDLGWVNEDDPDDVLAMNYKMQSKVDELMNNVAEAILEVQERQRIVIEKRSALRSAGRHHLMKKVPVQRYLPPYFKDGDQMCAPHSEEGNRRMQMTGFDPLMREEKKWSPIEIRRLREAVRNNIIQSRTDELRVRRDILQDKIRQSGQDVNPTDIATWKEDLEVTMRKLDFENNRSDLDLLATPEGSNIDWEKINNIDFGSAGRRADAIRLKWINEISPRLSQEQWTEEELKRLKDLKDKKRIDSWATVSNKLGHSRTPWQCFLKYKTDLYQDKKEWTQDEDQRLLRLCKVMKNNDKIPWGKVTAHMPGRKRQEVRVRYIRVLEIIIKHGPWTDQEDLLLIGAVNRLGARDWSKVAKAVPCRTDIQCKERWVSVMNRRLLAKQWTLDDDEKLIFLVATFGLGQWEKCADQLCGRTPEHCSLRYQTIMTSKSRFYNARNQNMTPDPTLSNLFSMVMEKSKATKFYTEWKEKENSLLSYNRVNKDETCIDDES